MSAAPQHWRMLTVTENNDLALGTKALWGSEFFLVPTDSCNRAIRAGPCWGRLRRFYDEGPHDNIPLRADGSDWIYDSSFE
jgi:hypothetical protein